MRGKSFIVLTILFLCTCPAFALIEFNDGQIHNIDYQVSDDVYVDYQTPEMYTTVNLLDGGTIGRPYEFCGYGNSRISVSGGSVLRLLSYDSSQIDITSGEIVAAYSGNFGQINISRGSAYSLTSYGAGQIDISGGFIFGGLRLYNQSIIQIFGYDFAVDG